MRFLDMLQSWQSVDRLSHLLLGDAQFVEALQVEPKLRCRSEEMSESQSCITCDSPPAVQDFRDTVGWDIELAAELGSAHT